MRLVAAAVLTGQAGTRLRAEPPIHLAMTHILAIIAGMLLLAGLWTPLSGLLVAVFELWSSFSQPGDPWAKILLGTLGVGLALLGPGAWSFDARLFGWKRIDIPGSKELDTQKSRQKSR
jgi:uncharacterized membrane protein YphA (DoxX/SURF4 family)